MFTSIVGQYYSHPMMDRDDVGAHPAMMLVCFVVFVLVVVGVYYLAKGSHNHESNGKKPLDYAKERYAKGELTKEQFDQMKRDLQT